jgi:2'-5' RNA ligase
LHELAAIPTTAKYAYLPHMTIAHYTEAAPIGNLPAIIAQFRDRHFGGFRVSHVEVVTMGLSNAYSSFDTYATLALRP